MREGGSGERGQTPWPDVRHTCSIRFSLATRPFFSVCVRETVVVMVVVVVRYILFLHYKLDTNLLSLGFRHFLFAGSWFVDWKKETKQGKIRKTAEPKTHT